MAAAVYQSPGVVTVEQRTVPRPGPDQLVVRVHSCGICGSDIHQLRDGWGFTPGAVAGHEWSGTIAAVGDDVTNWSVGELVVGGPGPRCGICRRCLEGKPSQCENRNSMTAEQADGAGLDQQSAAGMVQAVNEIATNSVRHGGGQGEIRTWIDGRSLVCEVSDLGHITAPLVGRLRPALTSAEGGLWLANQLCDLVQIHSSPGGTAVRVYWDF